MDVIHIIDSAGVFGAERILLTLMEEQARIGIHPVLLSLGTPGDGEKPLEIAAARLGLDVCRMRFGAGLNVSGAHRIAAALRERNADIAHAHGYKPDILLGILPRRARPAPVVATLHGWTSTRTWTKLAVYEWLDRRLLARADHVVAVEDSMVARLRGIEPTRISVIPNGISLQPEPAPSASDWLHDVAAFRAGHVLVGTTGRLSTEKGHADLLRAVAHLRHGHGLAVRLVIAGDGPLREPLAALASRLGLGEHVKFLGYVEGAHALLGELDFFALSSYTEGAPVTVLEAMRAGVPVIATRVGGIPHLLGADQEGALVPPGDPLALAETLRAALADPAARERRAAAARARFAREFSSPTMAGRYARLYESLITAGSPDLAAGVGPAPDVGEMRDSGAGR